MELIFVTFAFLAGFLGIIAVAVSYQERRDGEPKSRIRTYVERGAIISLLIAVLTALFGNVWSSDESQVETLQTTTIL